MSPSTADLPPVQLPPSQLLAAALTADPGHPFVTFYDETTGERIELSVATFANWVAKTANLLVDGPGLAPGDVVHLDLPRHWQQPVWAVAAWSAGLVVDVTGEPGDAALAVCGPAGIQAALAAPDVVALTLRPLGAPFGPGELPPGVLDYASEVAGYGDRFSGAYPFTGAQTGREATALATTWGLGQGGRLLLAAPLGPSPELLGSALVPLVRGGSVVLVRGEVTPERLDALAAVERVTASVRG
jgi:uncharacterized protein (TIGR03089 family)